MQIRIFTLQFNPLLGGFDEQPLRDFVTDKEVISLQDHFFQYDGRPYLTLILHYRQTVGPVTSGNKQKRDESWRKGLTGPDLALFNTLRDWRTARSRGDGVPPYVVFTNQQLAEIVKARPSTQAALGQIEGIGKSKLENYSAEILQLLQSDSEPGRNRDPVPQTTGPKG